MACREMLGDIYRRSLEGIYAPRAMECYAFGTARFRFEFGQHIWAVLRHVGSVGG